MDLKKEGGHLHGEDETYQEAMLNCVKHMFNKADPRHQWKVLKS
jgi:hypothetical protein